MKTSVVEKTNLVDLLGQYIDIFSALYVPHDNWLTKREKEFLIANIILNHKGYDLLSRSANSILENRFGFINRGVSIYRKKLRTKGWLTQTKTTIEVLKAFDYKDSQIPQELTFNILVKYKVDKK